jgi:hypothetical protein
VFEFPNFYVSKRAPSRRSGTAKPVRTSNLDTVPWGAVLPCLTLGVQGSDVTEGERAEEDEYLVVNARTENGLERGV